MPVNFLSAAERLRFNSFPSDLSNEDLIGFFTLSPFFEHPNGNEPRSKEALSHCYASILAQACNFGLVNMSRMSGFSYRKLAWHTTWYLREETLKNAFSELVNYQNRQPLAALWGGGTLSSSDGQRFPVSVKIRNAVALPKYFGYGRGLTYYTWTSDQYSQFGTKIVPTTIRDATYVLNEILDNETELTILAPDDRYRRLHRPCIRIVRLARSAIFAASGGSRRPETLLD